MTHEEHLIRLFTMDGKPYELSYEYRKSYSSWKKDKAVINRMIREGKVELIESTPKRKLFSYKGPVTN